MDTLKIVNRITELCDSKSISVNQMLKECGLSKSVVDNLKKGSIPSVDKLSAISEFFDVSVDYLLCRTENPAVVDDEWLATPVALSAPEGYDALTEEGKKQIQELIKILPKNTQD